MKQMKKKSPFKGDLEGLTNVSFVSFVSFVTITFSIHLLLRYLKSRSPT